MVRKGLSVVFAVLVCGAGAWAQGRGRAGEPRRLGHVARRGSFRVAPRMHRAFSHTGRHLFSGRSHRFRHPHPVLQSPRFYGYGHHDGYAYSPYYYGGYASPYYYSGSYATRYYAYSPQTDYYSPYFPYLYFYDLAYQEAIRSKEAAEQYEASVAREQSEHTASSDLPEQPEDVESTSTASEPAPLSPRDVLLTVDGETLAPSPSGKPLVLGSGPHTLRISSRHAESPAPAPAATSPY